MKVNTISPIRIQLEISRGCHQYRFEDWVAKRPSCVGLYLLYLDACASYNDGGVVL